MFVMRINQFRRLVISKFKFEFILWTIIILATGFLSSTVNVEGKPVPVPGPAKFTLPGGYVLALFKNSTPEPVEPEPSSSAPLPKISINNPDTVQDGMGENRNITRIVDIKIGGEDKLELNHGLTSQEKILYVAIAGAAFICGIFCIFCCCKICCAQDGDKKPERSKPYYHTHNNAVCRRLWPTHPYLSVSSSSSSSSASSSNSPDNYLYGPGAPSTDSSSAEHDRRLQYHYPSLYCGSQYCGSGSPTEGHH